MKITGMFLSSIFVIYLYVSWVGFWFERDIEKQDNLNFIMAVGIPLAIVITLGYYLASKI